jgi:hypothetical protein
MKRKELTSEYIMNYWLTKGHNITVQWLIENEPKLIKTPKWYKKYAVTQELHDEWYEWAINEICKCHHCSKKFAKRNFAFDYLNAAPNVKDPLK